MDKVKALEQLVTRLSHMADGVDEEVDALLVSIRKELKDGGDASKIETLSGRLARTMMASAGVNADKGRTVESGHDLSGLRKLIKTMPVRCDEQERMGSLVQQVASGTTAMARQKALVDLLGTVAEAFREVATPDKSASGVLGWLGKKSGPGGTDDRYVALFVQLLQRLLEHIDVVNGNALGSHAIKESLEQAVHPEQAQKLLAEVTDEIETIDARIRAERNQTTDFLGDLRERLDGFEEVINFLGDDCDSSLKRSEQLQSSVDEDTREMGEAAKSDDINQVRSVISSGLTKLTKRLAEHVLSERQQHETSKARVTELNERLSHLEDEADILRSEIRNKNDLALKDALTGVYNRAGYDERTHELYARWQRSGAPLSIVFVDCNKFKRINDTYGHTAGDLVLVKISDVLQLRARASDIVCRYGGDEFVILLPDTRVQGAEVFARSACDEVRNAGFNDNGKPLDVSIACGVTELTKGDTLESAVGRADEAMYQAKKMDGMKVCVVT
ncbi:diguanylate cyclase [Congregibacter sp.]|uniref:sensor domain-containing diguanylate cyclase n=1 Tax=Congregibacter sp. TaxID=2744308 RepID=UPI0039E41361